VRDAAGRADYPLSSTGREQAKRAGQHAKAFGAELLLSSSLHRARETAEIIGHETGLAIAASDPDLDEVNPGRAALSSVSFRDRQHALASAAMIAAHLFDRRVSSQRTGESAEQLLARIRRMFVRLEEYPASRIAIVSHGYWIFTAAWLIDPGLTLRSARIVHHCTRTRIAHDDARLRVVEFALPNA
jgi:broad specificity phosphatase PhoE